MCIVSKVENTSVAIVNAGYLQAVVSRGVAISHVLSADEVCPGQAHAASGDGGVAGLSVCGARHASDLRLRKLCARYHRVKTIITSCAVYCLVSSVLRP